MVKHQHTKMIKSLKIGQVLLPMGYEENSGFRAFFGLAFSESLWTVDLGWRMFRGWRLESSGRITVALWREPHHQRWLPVPVQRAHV